MNIDDEHGLDAALEELAALPEAEDATPEQVSRRMELEAAIGAYGKVGQVDYLSNEALVRHLVDGRGVALERIAADTKIDAATLAGVLDGTQVLRPPEAFALARYFHLSGGVFLFGDDAAAWGLGDD